MISLIHPLLVMLASLTRLSLARQVVFLRVENRKLHSRLPKRIVVSPSERSRFLTPGRDLGTQLREIIYIVSYDTFRRWVPAGVRHGADVSGPRCFRDARRSPNLPHVERVIQTLQHDALNRLVVISERHLNIVTRHPQNWYNSQRPHSARDHLPQGWADPPAQNNTASRREIVCTTRLGGLLKS